MGRPRKPRACLKNTLAEILLFSHFQKNDILFSITIVIFSYTASIFTDNLHLI